MARLNEPPVPAESIESLKKRFMRQNRDLARVNSTQSVRIRSLENEVSNLLADNLFLREQVSHYKLELEGGRAQQIAVHADGIKSQLEQRLKEITDLVGNLGHPPRQKRSPKSKGRISISNTEQAAAPRRSGFDYDQEGRLPPILEHKLYPRRTLEPQEIPDIGANDGVDTNDSPEVGPPPVSQFVDEDPVKIDLPRRERLATEEEDIVLNPSLTVNLEQRRKRKDSGGSSETRRSSQIHVFESSAETDSPMKAGAKRKFTVCEDIEASIAPLVDTQKSLNTVPPGKQSDKKRLSLLKDESATAELNNTALQTPSQEVPITSIRKVLAAKSVNKSPKKQIKTTSKDEQKVVKQPSSRPETDDKPKERKREVVRISVSNKPIPAVAMIHPEECEGIASASDNKLQPQSEPETPAAADLFSPPSSQPSTVRPESRDTPPPADLANGNEASRPSRRARGAVSYAEPNLRDKMRRPTKELVDAVSRDSSASRRSIDSIEDNAPRSAWRVKMEGGQEVDWKSIPSASATTVDNSPLRNKGVSPDSLPDNISTHRKRRESLLQQSESETSSSTSSNTIIALLAENRKAKAATAANGKVQDERKSASTSASLAIRDVKEGRENARRVSNASSNSRGAETSSDSIHSITADTNTSRRRQSTLGLNSSQPGVDGTRSKDATERLLKRPTSAIEMPSIAAAESRNDRISARRRSMML